MPLAVKDVIFRLGIPDHIPPTLNAGFLQGAGVVPEEWSLAQEPICTAEGAQLVYENGLILLAQGQVMSGQEPLDTPAAEHPQLAELLVRYCQALPLLSYQGLQTVLRVVIVYDGDIHAARRTVCEQMLQQGEWQTFGTVPMQPTLQLAYQLEDQVLTLTVAQAQVRQEEEAIGSALVFAGSFEQVVGEGDKLPQIQSMLRGWTARRDLLLDLITNRFKLS
jgi:hypothetical protein